MIPKPNNIIFDLNSYLALKKKEIDLYLENLLKSYSGCALDSRIYDAMEYALLGSGKRMRPILCIAAAQAVKANTQDVIRAACALEMIHTYSLIHDDLPAMDNDSIRRGKPTCHIAFDEATAILTGDALLTFAFQTLSINKSETGNKAETEKRIDSDCLLKVINRIAFAAGNGGMVEGQMMDVSSENRNLTRDELEKMHNLKTGALISASVYSGAVLGGGTDGQIEALEIFAKNIGLAFQVKDDILNIEGEPEIMGKAAGTDMIRNKNTYPLVIGLEESKKFAENLVSSALKALDCFDNKAEPLRHIAGYIIERKK